MLPVIPSFCHFTWQWVSPASGSGMIVFQNLHQVSLRIIFKEACQRICHWCLWLESGFVCKIWVEVTGEECVMFPEPGCYCICHQKSSKALLRFFEIHCFVFAFWTGGWDSTPFKPSWWGSVCISVFWKCEELFGGCGGHGVTFIWSFWSWAGTIWHSCWFILHSS